MSKLREEASKFIQVVKTFNGEKVVLQSPKPEVVKHLRSLYVYAHLNGCPLKKVLIDNEAIVNLCQQKL